MACSSRHLESPIKTEPCTEPPSPCGGRSCIDKLFIPSSALKQEIKCTCDLEVPNQRLAAALATHSNNSGQTANIQTGFVLFGMPVINLTNESGPLLLVLPKAVSPVVAKNCSPQLPEKSLEKSKPPPVSPSVPRSPTYTSTISPEATKQLLAENIDRFMASTSKLLKASTSPRQQHARPAVKQEEALVDSAHHQCSLCAAAFPSASELLYHTRKHHSTVTRTCGPISHALHYRCTINSCTCAFASGEELYSHVHIRHHSLRFICGTCFTIFRHREALVMHLRSTHHRRDLETDATSNSKFKRMRRDPGKRKIRTMYDDSSSEEVEEEEQQDNYSAEVKVNVTTTKRG